MGAPDPRRIVPRPRRSRQPHSSRSCCCRARLRRGRRVSPTRSGSPVPHKGRRSPTLYPAELSAQSAERPDVKGVRGAQVAAPKYRLCPNGAPAQQLAPTPGERAAGSWRPWAGGNPPPEAGPLPGNDQGMAPRRGGVESRILRVRRPLADGAVVALASVFALGTLSAPAQSSKTEIRVGALLSITGAGSSLGNTSRAALEVAVKRLNHQLKNAHVTLDIVDTGQDPDRAKAGFDKLAGEAGKLMIGPQTSREGAAVGDAANQRGAR